MKKQIRNVLCTTLALIMLLALTACGGESGGATALGTWHISEVEMRTIEQGKLAAAIGSVITVYSDNTFVLVNIGNTYYSSDGGETYVPTMDCTFTVYGKCETVDTNEELGERTIKVTEITRVLGGTEAGYNSDTDASDAAKEAIKNNDFIGYEMILTGDYKIAEQVRGPFLSMTNYGQ